MKTVHVFQHAKFVVPKRPGRKFIHIHNAGPDDVFINGDDDGVPVNSSNGLRIPAGQAWARDPIARVPNRIEAICASGQEANLKIQGVNHEEDHDGLLTAYQAAVSANGGTLPAAHLTAIKTFRDGLEESSLAGLVRFFWPCAGNEFAAAQVAFQNFPGRSLVLANNGFTDAAYTPSTGLKGDGVGFLNAHFALADFVSPANMHIGYIPTTGTPPTTNAMTWVGSSRGASTDVIRHTRDSSTNNGWENFQSTTGVAVVEDQQTIIGITRSADANNVRIYRGGVLGGVLARTVATTTNTHSFYILAENRAGVSSNKSDGLIQGVIAGYTLSDAQITTLDALLQTFRSNLSRT